MKVSIVRDLGCCSLLVLITMLHNPDVVGARETNVLATGVVVPAPRPRYPGIASAMNRQARSSFEDLGYSEVAGQRGRAVLRRANSGNTARCLDKTLIAIGKAAGADLVVCPRVANPGGVRSVRVRFARVSKKRVWSCMRPMRMKDGTSEERAAAKAVAVCMDQLLSSSPKAIGEEKKVEEEVVEEDDKKKNPKRHYLGITGLMAPASRERFTGYIGEQRYSKHMDYDFSGGVGLFYERRKISWLTFGMQFDYYSLGLHYEKKKKKDEEDEFAYFEEDPEPRLDRLNLFSLGATLRFLYPGDIVEPYLKMGFGLTIAGSRETEMYDGIVFGSGFGANYQIRAGIMATVSYVGIFFDVGMVDVLWFPNVGLSPYEFDSATMMNVIFALNAGLAAVF